MKSKKRIKLIKKQEIFGLKNNHKICYANAILQCLLRNTIIKQRIKKYKFENKISKNFYLLYKNTFILKKEREKYVQKILYNMNLNLEEENDPIIFFRDLLNSMTDEFGVLIRNTFKGELKTTISCQYCLKVDEISTFFINLNINNIYKKQSSLNCRYCSLTCTLTEEIVKIPECLVLSNTVINKINTQRNLFVNNIQYSLHSEIHYDSNHFYAIIHDPLNMIFNDEVVKPYDDKVNNNKNLIMLFYNKTDKVN
jgi:hypothetical protein